MYKERFRVAHENDRKKISELEAIMKQFKASHGNFDQRVQELMNEQLKVRINID